eukprot:TRINITY_DN9744_c1_g1_i1.p1 TRINITY_DN9744_c1_g1~~TRINITY_DN9744_c1_g1_i1.p1  ORF type:complete len:286 (+),score=68.84 TRINITY_DN9744_c1_g1_i1:47-859(+)
MLAMKSLARARSGLLLHGAKQRRWQQQTTAEEDGKKVLWYALWRSEKGKKWLKWGAGLYLGMLGTAYCGLWYTRGLALEENTTTNEGNKLRLGGHLSLTDHTGKKFNTETELKGKWWIVYFGFASCPTVCPAELTKITETVTSLEQEFGDGCITPLFVTLDPERDSPAAMKEFLKPFHKDFIGLTGTEDEVSEAAKKFRVYYSVIDTEDQDLSPGGTPTDYQLDHSCIIYVMNQNGVFCDFFSKETNGGIAVEKVARHLDGTMDFMNKSE